MTDKYLQISEDRYQILNQLFHLYIKTDYINPLDQLNLFLEMNDYYDQLKLYERKYNTDIILTCLPIYSKLFSNKELLDNIKCEPYELRFYTKWKYQKQLRYLIQLRNREIYPLIRKHLKQFGCYNELYKHMINTLSNLIKFTKLIQKNKDKQYYLNQLKKPK